MRSIGIGVSFAIVYSIANSIAVSSADVDSVEAIDMFIQTRRLGNRRWNGFQDRALVPPYPKLLTEARTTELALGPLH